MKIKKHWILLSLFVLICVILFGNNVISYISLFITLFSVMAMFYIEKRKLDLEEEKRKEEKAALIIAYFHLINGVKKLRIENKLRGEARNIKVLLDNHLLDEQYPLWWEKQPPITIKLNSYEFRDYILHLPASKVPKIAKIYWSDDVKENNVNECMLPL